MTPIIGDFISNTVGKVVQGAIDIVKKMVPDKDKAAEIEAALQTQAIALELELRKQEHDEKMGQIDINKIEAASEDPFVRRWRPAIGWICAAAMAYNFLLFPFAEWGVALYLLNHPEVKAIPFPTLPDPQTLMVLLGALLGLGGFRTFEKIKGTK